MMSALDNAVVDKPIAQAELAELREGYAAAVLRANRHELDFALCLAECE